MITENLSTLKINKLTQAQYDRELAAGNIDENALYLTPDDTVIDVAQGGTGYTTLEDTTYTTVRYRASSLNSTETMPDINGSICWTYE